MRILTGSRSIFISWIILTDSGGEKDTGGVREEAVVIQTGEKECYSLQGNSVETEDEETSRE